MVTDTSLLPNPRRSFLQAGAVLGAAAAVPASLFAQKKSGTEGGDEDVSTNEDLMREHGILKRVLLIYDEVIRRIEAQQEFSAQSVSGAGLRSFEGLLRTTTKSWKKNICSHGFEGRTNWLTWSMSFTRSIRPAGASLTAWLRASRI